MFISGWFTVGASAGGLMAEKLALGAQRLALGECAAARCAHRTVRDDLPIESIKRKNYRSQAFSIMLSSVLFT